MGSKGKIVIGEFILDCEKRCLWRDKESIALPPKALSLLQYLVDNRGRLISKDELLSAVWPNTFISDAVLKVNIQQLRSLLQDRPKEPRFIETIYRRGYRFIGDVSEIADDGFSSPWAETK